MAWAPRGWHYIAIVEIERRHGGQIARLRGDLPAGADCRLLAGAEEHALCEFLSASDRTPVPRSCRVRDRTGSELSVVSVVSVV